MDRTLPQGCLSNNEATPTTDKEYKQYLERGSIDEATIAEWQLLTEPASSVKPSRQRYRDSGRKFSSLRPNRALLWALIDDSILNTEDHELALAIMEGWQPKPWLGMVWRGVVGQDRVWNGSEWKAPTLAAQAPQEQPAIQPLTTPMATESRPSVKVSEAIAHRYASMIDAVEVNEAFVSDPDGTLGILWPTILAFARSRERQAQCQKLIMRSPQTSIEVDDIFTDFILDLRNRMPSQYTHQGKLDRWIAVIWGRYFFKEIQQNVYRYLNSTSFINNKSVGDPGFKFEKNCVNTAKISADEEDWHPKGCGIGYAFPTSKAEQILRELDDPTKPMGQLSEAAKTMVRLLATGITQTEAGRRLGFDERRVSRLMEKIRAKGQEMLGENTVPSIQACSDDGNLLEWSNPDCVIDSLHATANEISAKFLTPNDAAEFLGGLNARTVVRWAREGYLPAIPIGEGKRRLWRFLRTDLEEWMLARRQGGQNAA